MKRQWIVIAGFLVALALVGWLITIGANRVYFARKGPLTEDITKLEIRLNGMRKDLDRSATVQRSLTDYANRTLGSDLETVDHRLRMRLNRIAEDVGMGSVIVGTGRHTNRQSPARTAMPRTWRAFRDSLDFVELEGSISGEGTFEQAVRLIDRIDAEPWLKRIEHLKIDPKAKGERIKVMVRLVTLFLPGLERTETLEIAYDESRLDRFSDLIASNPFVLPAPSPQPEPALPVQPPEAAKPTFAWGQWRLTGVADGPDGPEVWLRNGKSGSTKVLVIGETLHKAKLVSAVGEGAEFTIDERRFRVEVGQKLSQRTWVDR